MHATSCWARMWKLRRELARRMSGSTSAASSELVDHAHGVDDLKLGVGKDAHAVVKAADVIKGSVSVWLLLLGAVKSYLVAWPAADRPAARFWQHTTVVLLPPRRRHWHAAAFTLRHMRADARRRDDDV